MLIGSVFLLRIWLPIEIPLNWALIFIGLGISLLILAGRSGQGGLAVGACMLCGLGAIFYYQIITDDWNSWAYLWTLIPGFIGVGIILASLIDARQKVDPAGFFLILLSGFGFLFFGSLFGGVSFFGRDMSIFLPGLLILIGVYQIIRSWVKFISKG